MTDHELHELENKYPGLFTTSNMAINTGALPSGVPVIVSNLLFCCGFPTCYHLSGDFKYKVATCPVCDKIDSRPLADDDDSLTRQMDKIKRLSSEPVDWDNVIYIGIDLRHLGTSEAINDIR